MSAAVIAACLWVVLAQVLAVLPSRTNHWRQAYLLIALGIPILGWLTVTNGPWAGLIALAVGASVLRWPVIHLGRSIRRRGRTEGQRP